MWCRIVAIAKAVLLSAAALLVLAPPVLGGVVHSGNGSSSSPAPAPAPAVRPPPAAVTISIAVPMPAQDTAQSAYLNLRGPSGQVRRFAVEGGAEQLSARVVILRPGQSVTIPVVAGK
jgi:hypothetical protein